MFTHYRRRISSSREDVSMITEVHNAQQIVKRNVDSRPYSVQKTAGDA